jgi:translation initiation factor 4E
MYDGTTETQCKSGYLIQLNGSSCLTQKYFKSTTKVNNERVVDNYHRQLVKMKLEVTDQANSIDEEPVNDSCDELTVNDENPSITSLDVQNNTVIPLNATWTIWYDNPRLAPPGSDWKENLKQCGSFDTVESFWRVFNNLKPASELTINSNYSVFRYGIEPSWEDPANTEGGKFVHTILKKDSKLGRCDESWLFTVLAIIGETMDATGNQINGAVVSIRKQQDRIGLWLKNNDRDACVQIGERWKKVLKLEKATLRYQTHRDAAASGRSFRNEAQFEV